MKTMSEVEPYTGGHFSYRGIKSAKILCGDVADRFPCAHCRAGLDGNNLRCRDPQRSAIDEATYKAWYKEVCNG